ncbi:MAG TPA: UPF0280 family protein [Firmicutes bacterium]|nr:UPF0280 family protein [Bacillota bacterium]
MVYAGYTGLYAERTYRNLVRGDDLRTFTVAVAETDLLIKAGSDLRDLALQAVIECRADLESYIARDPVFRTTLVPHRLLPGAPDIAVTMARAARLAGVGPMAAVAGAIAEWVGRRLLERSDEARGEVIVENGGDIFMASKRDRRVGIFAGDSPFTNRIAIEIPPSDMPLGICTSAGTVGHSLSLGRADAAVALARDAALADAAATAIGNLVRTPEDIAGAMEFARQIKGLMGALVIKGDKMAIYGRVKLVPVR